MEFFEEKLGNTIEIDFIISLWSDVNDSVEENVSNIVWNEIRYVMENEIENEIYEQIKR